LPAGQGPCMLCLIRLAALAITSSPQTKPGDL
jgi:hypothetical protein